MSKIFMLRYSMSVRARERRGEDLLRFLREMRGATEQIAEVGPSER